MNTNSLIKFQTIAAIVACTFAFASNGFAQTVAPAESSDAAYARSCPNGRTTSVLCEELYVKNNPSAAQNSCSAVLTSVQEAARTLGRYGASVKRAADCEAEEARAGISSIENDDVDNIADDDRTDEQIQRSEQCESVRVSGCSEIKEADPAKSMRDAVKDENDAKKDLLDAQQNLAKQLKTINRRMTENQQREKEDERKYQLKLEEISKSLEAQNKAADQELRKAVGQARAAMTGKQNELSGLNDQLRGAELKVAAATTRWEGSCRTEANGKLEATKKEQKDEDARAKAARELRNYSGSSLAGASNRKKATRLREQQLNYNNAYKNCLAGTSAAGAASKNAIEDAKAELEAAKKSLEEKRAVLQQQINDMMKDLVDLQTATAENKDSMKKAAESAINAANVARLSAQERAAKERTELNEDLQEAQTFGNQSIQLATSAVTSATGLAQQATMRNSCSSRRVTSEEANRNYEKYNSINEAAAVKNDTCLQYYSAINATCRNELATLCAERESSSTPRAPTPRPSYSAPGSAR